MKNLIYNPVVVLLFAIFMAHLIQLILKEWRYRKSNGKSKHKFLENINSIETSLNDQITKSHIFENRLDMLQISLSKSMSDIRYEFKQDFKIASNDLSKAQSNETSSIKKEKPITPPSKAITTHKELVEVLESKVVKEIKGKKYPTKRTGSKLFTDTDIHMEILRKTKKRWYVIRNAKGEEAYQKEYNNAYQRLLYRLHQENK